MKRALLFILVLALGVSAIAKEPPPPAGPARPVTLPKIQTFTLDNGMKVTLVPFGNVPRAEVVLAIHAGNADLPEKVRRVGDLYASLVTEGTETLDAAALAKVAAGMGGEIGAVAGLFQTQVTSAALSEKVPDMVRLVGEVALHPALPASELPRLKEALIRRNAIVLGQAQAVAGEEARALMYPRQPYGYRLPPPGEIQRYSIEDVRAFAANELGAARAHLYVVGMFDPAPVEAAARATFAGWAAGKPAVVPKVKPATTRAVHLIDRKGAVQSSLWFGLPVIDPTDPQFIALRVVNALLGGSFSSRITSNIRENKGYTYSPRSQVLPYLGTSTWAELADVKTEATGASLTEIVKEIDGLAKTAPPPEELLAIQRYVVGSFVLEMATIDGISAQLEYADRYGLPADYLETYVDRVMAVTPADVQRLTRTYLKSSKMTLVVVGDTATVRKQLLPFGTVVEVKPTAPAK